jgi:ribosome biogenesis GTPase A
MTATFHSGHMHKALKQLLAKLPFIDLVLLVIDARIPFSSRNVKLENQFGTIPKILLLNKKDLANPAVTSTWLNYFKKLNLSAYAIQSDCQTGIAPLLKIIHQHRARLGEQRALHGNQNLSLKILVAGIPNVGKSSLINRLIKSGKAKVGQFPGITRSLQWLILPGNLFILDTPGIFAPKIENPEIFTRLAACGCIKSGNYDPVEAAEWLWHYLSNAGILDSGLSLSGLGKAKGFLGKDGVVDYEKSCGFFLKTFQDGKFGKISLESPALQVKE